MAIREERLSRRLTSIAVHHRTPHVVLDHQKDNARTLLELGRVIEVNGSVKRVSAEQFILHQGDNNNRVWTVGKGLVKSIISPLLGNLDRIVTIYKAGDVFNLTALTSKQCNTSIVAMGNATLYSLPASDLLKLSKKNSANMIVAIIDAQQSELERHLINSVIGSKGRAAQALLFLSNHLTHQLGAGEFSQTTISELSNITRVTFQRILNSFKKMGLVSVAEGRKIIVLNAEGLSAYCAI